MANNLSTGITLFDPKPYTLILSPSWTPLTVTEARHRLKSDLPLRQIRIYSDGVFDLFHGGHAEQFRQAKYAFPNVYLIVGVCCDEDVLRYKGTRPVMTIDERCDAVRHCRYVDEIIRCPPFYFSLQYLDSIQADMAAHDALPYGSPDLDDCYAPFKRADRFIATQRKPHISTTDLIARIVRDVDTYSRRNATRHVIENTENTEYSSEKQNIRN